MKNYKINYNSFFGYLLFWIFKNNNAKKNAQIGIIENEVILKTDVYEGKIKRFSNYIALFVRYLLPFLFGSYLIMDISYSKNNSILFFSLVFAVLITLFFTKTNFFKIKLLYVFILYFVLTIFFIAFIFLNFDYSFFRSVIIYSLNYFIIILVFYKILMDFLSLKNKKFFYLWEKRLVIYV